MKRASMTWVGLLALVVGCGGVEKVNSGGHDTTSGGNAAGGGGGGEQCPQFVAPVALASVDIIVTNDRMTPVKISDGICLHRFQVTIDGATTPGELSGFDLTCTQVESMVGYPLDCDGFNEVEITPGESIKLTWDGILYQTTTLPKHCAADPNNPFVNNCIAPKAAGPSMVTVQVAIIDPSGIHEVAQTFSYPGTNEVAISIQ